MREGITIHHDVKEKDSPLKILTGSYKFGATHYPHYIRPGSKKNEWFYSNLNGDHMRCNQINIYGKSGKLFCFHGLNLHGTALNFSTSPRISLRYLILSMLFQSFQEVDLELF